MAKTTPLEFYRQVRSEMQRVTWPSKKELSASTVAVFVMVVVAAIFLFLADQVMAFAVNLILGL